MILGFCGDSNSGKSTMIESVIPQLVERGLTVGVIKHTPHGVDVEGKDSFRFRNAGASVVVLYGEEIVEFRKPRSVFSTVRALQEQVDVVLVEGFKREKFIPKVCFSEGCEGCVISEPSREHVLEHILEQVEIERIERKLPGFNCGECGHRNCHEMASAIYEGADEFRNCRYWNPHAVVSVQVNGRDIYMGKFAQDILVNTLTGLLSSFKGVKDVSEVNIRYRKQK